MSWGVNTFVFFLLLIVCVTITGFLPSQSTVNFVLIKWLKRPFMSIGICSVTLQNVEVVVDTRQDRRKCKL